MNYLYTSIHSGLTRTIDMTLVVDFLEKKYTLPAEVFNSDSVDDHNSSTV